MSQLVDAFAALYDNSLMAEVVVLGTQRTLDAHVIEQIHHALDHQVSNVLIRGGLH